MPRPFSLHITDHTIDRYREHVRDANDVTVLNAILYGTPIEVDLAKSLMQRSSDGGQVGDIYIVTESKRGLFVINFRMVVVTYIRLSKGATDILNTPTYSELEVKKVVTWLFEIDDLYELRAEAVEQYPWLKEVYKTALEEKLTPPEFILESDDSVVE